MAERVSEEVVVAKMKRVAAELGYVPTNSEWSEVHGGTNLYCAAIERIWGGYGKACLAIFGQKPKHGRAVGDPDGTQALAAIKQLEDELGHVPRYKEFLAKYHYRHFGALERIWGGYVGACEHLYGSYRQTQYTDEQLLEALRQLAAKLGHSPNQTEIINYRSEQGGPSLNKETLIARFGDVNEALIKAGLDAVVRVGRSSTLGIYVYLNRDQYFQYLVDGRIPDKLLPTRKRRTTATRLSDKLNKGDT